MNLNPWEMNLEVVGGGVTPTSSPTQEYNTGNIRTSASNPEFRKYSTVEEGVADHQRLLRDYQSKHGLTTIKDVINRWAPPSENDTSNYVKFMSQKMGMNPNDTIDFNDPEILGKFSYYQAQMEKGANKVPVSMDEMIGIAGGSTKDPWEQGFEVAQEPWERGFEAEEVRPGMKEDGSIDTTSEHWKGKSAIQIYEEAYGRDAQGVGVTQPESQAASGMTENVDQKIDAETWIKNRADEFLRDNMDMTRREAMKKAEDAYQGEVAELGVDLALSAAVPYRLTNSIVKGAAATSAITGTAAVTGNVVAGKDVGEGVGEKMVLGGTLGAIGGKISTPKNASLKKLEDIGSGYDTILKRDYTSNELRNLESAFMKTDNANIKDFRWAVDSINNETPIQEALDKAGITWYKATPFREFTDNLPETTLSKTISGQGFDVTVEDVVVARNTAKDLLKLNKKGAKVGAHNLGKSVAKDNADLGTKIMEASGSLESLAVKASKSPTFSGMAETFGLTTKDIAKARINAVDDAMVDVYSELQKLKSSGKTVDVNFPDIEKKLTEAVNALKGSDYKAFSKARKELEGKISTTPEMNKFLNTIDTFAEVIQNTKKKDVVGSTLADWGIPTIVALTSDLMSGGITKLGQASIKAGVNKLTASTTNKRLKEVEKALGGKFELDSVAMRMLKNGASKGDIIAYLLLKDLTKDTSKE